MYSQQQMYTRAAQKAKKVYRIIFATSLFSRETKDDECLDPLFFHLSEKEKMQMKNNTYCRFFSFV